MKNGGKLIESGGFGCIFKPQLKCNPNQILAGDNKYFGEKGITKLMRTKHGINEYKEIKRFIPILKTIPNYKKYFIISDYTLCNPRPLSENDLVDFNKVKCSPLKKLNITSKNINNNLNELLAINMPYGGLDVDAFIKKVIYKRNIIVKFNNKMIDLLTNAIIPMNKKGIFHGDLKSNNILVNVENNKLVLKIIDWGLSGLYIPNVTNESQFSESGFSDDWKFIPSKFRDRPFQYNVPFSSILFSNDFNEIYSNLLISKNGKITNYEIKEFVISFFQEYVDTYKSGHLATFNSIFNHHKKLISLFSENNDSIRNNQIRINNKMVYNNIDYIYQYIYEILLKFSKPYSFDVLGYFSQVYTKNMDVWGFVMSYVALCDYAQNIMHQNYNTKVHNNMKLLLDILLKYSDRPIDISEVKKTLLYFNSQIDTKKRKKNKTKKKTSK
jgi:hypothetical protein